MGSDRRGVHDSIQQFWRASGRLVCTKTIRIQTHVRLIVLDALGPWAAEISSATSPTPFTRAFVAGFSRSIRWGAQEFYWLPQFWELPSFALKKENCSKCSAGKFLVSEDWRWPHHWEWLHHTTADFIVWGSFSRSPWPWRSWMVRDVLMPTRQVMHVDLQALCPVPFVALRLASWWLVLLGRSRPGDFGQKKCRQKNRISESMIPWF